MSKKKIQKSNSGSQTYSAIAYILLAVLVVMSIVFIYKKSQTDEKVLPSDEISEQVGPEDEL